jgi:hypothetical protein
MTSFEDAREQAAGLLAAQLGPEAVEGVSTFCAHLELLASSSIELVPADPALRLLGVLLAAIMAYIVVSFLLRLLLLGLAGVGVIALGLLFFA